MIVHRDVRVNSSNFVHKGDFIVRKCDFYFLHHFTQQTYRDFLEVKKNTKNAILLGNHVHILQIILNFNHDAWNRIHSFVDVFISFEDDYLEWQLGERVSSLPATHTNKLLSMIGVF